MNYFDTRDCYCGHCYYCKGEKGDVGPQGAKGEKGDKGAAGPRGEIGFTGAQGEKGDPFTTIYGVFYGFPQGPISGGGILNPTIVPVTNSVGITSPNAFTLTSDGRVIINESGMYLITSRIQVELGHSGNFSIKYNERGSLSNTLNSATVLDGGTATITTVAALRAGDIIANGYITSTPINFAPYVEQVRSPTSTITILKVADLPEGYTFDDNQPDEAIQQI